MLSDCTRKEQHANKGNLVHNSSFAAFPQVANKNNFAASGINGVDYRASIDMTASVSAHVAKNVGNKRNELYAMLRDEVLAHLKQKEVSQ